MIAVKLTDIENWETNTRYQDELTAKLTIFNFINSYTALAYAIFIPHRWVVNGTCDIIFRGVPGGRGSQFREQLAVDALRLRQVPHVLS